MYKPPTEFMERKKRTVGRLAETRGAFEAASLRDDRYPLVTIFATGSFGRHELGEHSDLDLFIVDTAQEGHDDAEPISRLDEYVLMASLISAGEGAGFPKFSRDGEFLKTHGLGDLIQHLGRPTEDHLNIFTARMLLLLESHCLMGQTAYDLAIRTVIGRYWAENGERHDHFRPAMLLNDIVRYWKTLCLSYEGWREGPGRSLDPSEKISLLKLKFNRLWLCFNGLCFLLLGDAQRQFTINHALRLVQLTPLDRMIEIRSTAFRHDEEANDARVSEVERFVDEVLESYAWWMKQTAPPKVEQEEWITEEGAYEEACEHARNFGDHMWRLVVLLGDRVNLTRYLLV